MYSILAGLFNVEKRGVLLALFADVGWLASCAQDRPVMAPPTSLIKVM